MTSPTICVYAICKNEEKFVERWLNSVHDADCIVILDTGSTDHTIEKLKADARVSVYEATIDPWEFDTARNKALSLIPEDIDICISLDLDEVLLPGWYEHLRSAWSDEMTAAQCRFVWHFKEDGSEDGVFWPVRIHTRHNYKWVYPIHEVITYTGSKRPVIGSIEDLQINHYPDPHKKRDYLTLLERAVAAHPDEPRQLFYLGREYYYHQKYQQCIESLNHYLTLSHWPEERCGAMRFIAKSFYQLDDPIKAVEFLLKANVEAPALRESLIDLALIYYSSKDWERTLFYAQKALQISTQCQTFINDGYAWDATPYDLCSIASFHLGHYDKALAYALQCLNFSPHDERFLQNIRFYQDYILSH